MHTELKKPLIRLEIGVWIEMAWKFAQEIVDWIFLKLFAYKFPPSILALTVTTTEPTQIRQNTVPNIELLSSESALKVKVLFEVRIYSRLKRPFQGLFLTQQA